MRNLLIYRYISEVAKSGSVRKAAEKLAITPSSLNRRVQSFEYEIGAPIFERSSKGVLLNPAGELVVHSFRKRWLEFISSARFRYDRYGVNK